MLPQVDLRPEFLGKKNKHGINFILNAKIVKYLADTDIQS